MNRSKKVICLTLAILFLALSCLFLWQKDNIGAMILYLRTDSETISAQKYQLDLHHKEELEDATGEEILVTLPSAEQCEDLLSGTVTSEQVKDELGLTAPLEQPPVAQKTDTLGSIVNDCAAELAGYKVDVMSKLGSAKAEVLAQWAALPSEEKTSSKKTALIMDGLQLCYTYEVEVDTAVEGCLNRYRAKLEAIGEDPSVMDLFWKHYCNEKKTEKAFYLDKYLS